MVDKLAKYFGGLKAVDEVSLAARRGSVHALIGPNGSGKTTFINVVTGLYVATGGTITFVGRDITKLAPHERNRSGLARTFQNIRVFRGLSVLGSNDAGKSTTLRCISGLVDHVSGEIKLAGQSIRGLKPEAIVRLGISRVPEGRRVFPGLTVRENILLGASNRKNVPRRQMEDEVDGMLDIFPDLKRLCGLTDGNLSRHLAVLQEADLVSLEKGYDQNRPQTLCRLTPSGRTRFLDYLGVLEQVVRDAAQAAGRPQNAAGRSQAADDRPAGHDRSGLAKPV